MDDLLDLDGLDGDTLFGVQPQAASIEDVFGGLPTPEKKAPIDTSTAAILARAAQHGTSSPSWDKLATESPTLFKASPQALHASPAPGAGDDGEDDEVFIGAPTIKERCMATLTSSAPEAALHQPAVVSAPSSNTATPHIDQAVEEEVEEEEGEIFFGPVTTKECRQKMVSIAKELGREVPTCSKPKPAVEAEEEQAAVVDTVATAPAQAPAASRLKRPSRLARPNKTKSSFHSPVRSTITDLRSSPRAAPLSPSSIPRNASLAALKAPESRSSPLGASPAATRQIRNSKPKQATAKKQQPPPAKAPQAARKTPATNKSSLAKPTKPTRSSSPRSTASPKLRPAAKPANKKGPRSRSRTSSSPAVSSPLQNATNRPKVNPILLAVLAKADKSRLPKMAAKPKSSKEMMAEAVAQSRKNKQEREAAKAEKRELEETSSADPAFQPATLEDATVLPTTTARRKRRSVPSRRSSAGSVLSEFPSPAKLAATPQAKIVHTPLKATKSNTPPTASGWSPICKPRSFEDIQNLYVNTAW